MRLRDRFVDTVSGCRVRVSKGPIAAGLLVAALAVSLGAVGLGPLVAEGQSPPPVSVAKPAMARVVQPLPSGKESPLILGTAGIGSVWSQLAQPVEGLTPSAPGEFAHAASFSVVLAPPLRPNEVFGVVPYWALPDAAGLDLTGLTTVVYAGLDVNPDGSIQTSGAAWDGYLSQDFMNLIGSAHDDGARVVLGIQDFDQTSLTQLLANPVASTNLAQSVLLLLKMRDLDGVNLDLEGQGWQGQAAMTNLVSAVSQTLKAADAHYQVTLDTDASSAGTVGGFYDLPALNASVDGFLITDDQLNLAAVPSTSSAMTSAGESVQATINEYLSEVPASKVVAVLPLFGLEWPTTDSTLGAKPVGAPSVETAGAAQANRRGALWDPITQTAWAPFRVGEQWHEAFFETPRSLRLALQTVHANGIAGVGVWGIGTDGTNDAHVVSALGASATPGNATGASNGASVSTTTTTTTTTTTSTTTSQPSVAQATTTSTSTAPSAHATSSSPSPNHAPYTFSGVWIGARTNVLPTVVPAGTQTAVGVVSRFKTNFPGLSCLTHEQFLEVFVLAGHPDDFYVIARTRQGDCTNGAFVFYDPTSPVPAPGS